MFWRDVISPDVPVRKSPLRKSSAAKQAAQLEERRSDLVERLFDISTDEHAALWFVESGAERKQQARAFNYHSELRARCSESVSPDMAERIDMDASRCTHEEETDARTIDTVRSVLLCYAVHNPKIGYSQGMNTLVAAFFQSLKDEERSFWVLCAFVEDLATVPESYYDSELTGLRIDIRAFQHMLHQWLPQVHAKITALDLDLSLFCVDMFASCHFNHVSEPCRSLLWDCCFVFGHTQAVFGASAAFFEHISSAFLQLSSMSQALEMMAGLTRSWKRLSTEAPHLAAKRVVFWACRADESLELIQERRHDARVDLEIQTPHDQDTTIWNALEYETGRITESDIGSSAGVPQVDNSDAAYSASGKLDYYAQWKKS